MLKSGLNALILRFRDGPGQKNTKVIPMSCGRIIETDAASDK
jgi:hypothetical protein